jgi:S1-C subfamily serine protease
MQPGDVVLAINGKSVADTRALVSETAALSPGTRAELTVARAGGQSKLTVELGRRPAPRRTQQRP